MTRPKLRRPCVDCQSPTRPAPYPGPRCATDDRAARQRSREKARDAYLLRTYNITLETYLTMLAAQGGTCAWPGCPASGKARFLAVDHDHACCPGPTSCGKCVRGLLCFVHNRAIGQAGDDPTVFEGVAAYLRRPRHLTQEEQMVVECDALGPTWNGWAVPLDAARAAARSWSVLVSLLSESSPEPNDGDVPDNPGGISLGDIAEAADADNGD